jgi:hypothetical protein
MPVSPRNQLQGRQEALGLEPIGTLVFFTQCTCGNMTTNDQYLINTQRKKRSVVVLEKFRKYPDKRTREIPGETLLGKAGYTHKPVG